MSRNATAALPDYDPPASLTDALALIARVFDVDDILADQGRDIVETYYDHSEKGYRRFHSEAGCMHLAINRDGRFAADGYYEQAREVGRQLEAVGARDCLELGSGFGFNTLYLSRRHPNVHFTGLDLMDRHVRAARREAIGLANVAFQCGSFEQARFPTQSVDVVFGVECLCYAQDLDELHARVAQALRPGGRYVLFDAYRREGVERRPQPMQTATRLTEITMAVTQGFRPVADWTDAMQRAGLEVKVVEDLSAAVLPTFLRMQSFAMDFFERQWRARMANAIYSKYLLRNTVAGLLWPYTISGDDATLSYQMIVAEKPEQA
ncbi:MAG: methyltransferase domain-containing protein [Ectothiorhodospiraceae bacterium]|jgi:SAM-dependent methyltransferase|nr:methyltransferase domain-containing protein [Ectothiorhodospiraceae bacterium]